MLQIPAFLCRQTDLLEAAGATGRAANITKGQWMHPDGMRGAVEKVRSAGRRWPSGAAHEPAVHSPTADLPPEVAVTERGSCFGYGDLVVDMRGFTRMRDACECPVIFDATQSGQRPGRGSGGASGGLREFIPPLALAAVGAG